MIQALKKLTILIGILLIMGYVGNLLLDNPYMHGILRNAINRQLEEYTYLNVKFEAVSAKFLPPGIEIYGVEVRGDASTEFLRVAHLQANLSYKALLFSRKELFNLEINDPRIRLPLPPLDKILRMEKFPDLAKDEGPPTWPPKQPLPFYRIVVTNGQVSYRLEEAGAERIGLVANGIDLELNYRSWSRFQLDVEALKTSVSVDGSPLLSDARIQARLSKSERGMQSDLFKITSAELKGEGDLTLGFQLTPPSKTGQKLIGLDLTVNQTLAAADLGILGRYLKIEDTDGTLRGRTTVQLGIPLDERPITWSLSGEAQAREGRIAGFRIFEAKSEFRIDEKGIAFDKTELIKDDRTQIKGKGFLSFQKDSRIDFDLQPENIALKDLMTVLQVDGFTAFESVLAPTHLKLTGQMSPFHLGISGNLILDRFSFPFVKDLGTAYPEPPRCELEAELEVTEKVFTIVKGDGNCRTGGSGQHPESPLSIRGDIFFSQKEGMDLAIASPGIDGSLLNHFVKLPLQAVLKTGVAIKGPYDKLVITGEVESPHISIAGFETRQTHAAFALPIAENRVVVKEFDAEVGEGGSIALHDFTLGFAADLPFAFNVDAHRLPKSFVGDGLAHVTGKPGLSFAVDSLSGRLNGLLRLPLQYQGRLEVALKDVKWQDELLLTQMRTSFIGSAGGQKLTGGSAVLGPIATRFDISTEFGKAAHSAPLPSFLQGLGIDAKTLIRVGLHTENKTKDQIRTNKAIDADDNLAALPFAGTFFHAQGIGGIIELDTDLEGPAGRLQGKIDGALQRPFLLGMPVSAFSFSGFLDGTKLQLPEFRHAGNSLVGRLNIDFGKPELPYDWYIYLKQFDARAVLGKVFADDPRNYAYLTAEWTMAGELQNFWKSRGEVVFVDLKSKLYRNLGSRTSAMELNSSQTVRVEISPERWSFEGNRPLKLHGDFFDLQLSAGENRLPDKLDLRMQGSIRLDILKSFTNLAETARGELILDGYLKGSLKAPEFSMRIQERKLDPFNVKEWTPVALGLVNYGPSLSALSLDVEVKQDRLVVHRFRANKGREGTIEITGTLLFDQNGKDVSHLLINLDRIEFNRLQIPVLKSADAVISGDLTLSGNDFPFNLSGNLKVDRFQSIGSFDLRREIVASLYESKLFTSTGGSGPPVALLNLDIGLQAERSILVKNKTIEALLSANLRIRGTDTQPLLLGQIIADSGTFNYRRAFKITQAVVSFDEPVSPPNPRLDISGEAIINPYKVTVQVAGDLSNPKVTLTSDPPTRDDGTAISSLDIVLLITSGKISETANKTAEKASVNEIFSSILVFAEEPIEKLFDLSGQTVVREVYIDSYLSEVQQRPITRLNVPFNIFNSANAVVQVDDESNTKISFEYPLHEGITFTGSLDRKANKRTDAENNLPKDTGFDLKFRFGFGLRVFIAAAPRSPTLGAKGLAAGTRVRSMNSPSSQIRAVRRFTLVLIASLLVAPSLFARSWELRTQSTVLQKQATELRVQFPDLKTAADVDNLANQFAEGNALSFLSTSLDGDTVVFEAEIAQIIRAITIETLTRGLRFELESKIGKYIGQTDSAELRTQIMEEIRADLRNRAFYQARLRFVPTPDSEGLAYDLIVDEGYPCRISRIESSFRLPASVKSPFKVGMDCSIGEVRSLLGELENALVAAGYNLQRIQTPELVFHEQTNTATLKIEGSLGRKIRYKVLSPITSPGMLSLMFGDSLNTLDPSITDPDAMASELVRKYQAQGYDDVEVLRPRVVNPDSETIEYQFTVNPGTEYRVVDVQYEGLISMTPDEASEAIDLKPSVGNAPIFSRDLVIASRERLLAIYRQRGYWDIGVFEPRVIKNPGNGEVKIVFVIREGKKRVFEKAIVLGNQAISTRTILDLITLEPGDSLDRQKLVDFEKQLRAIYRQKGFLHLEIAVDLQQNRDLRDVETRLVIQITENQRSRFGEVFVKGLIRTHPKIVQREMRFKPGDAFDPDLVEESRQAIAELGLFSSISMVPLESAGGNSIISYSILVREARSGTIGFGPGWSRAEGLRFSIESSYNNFDGMGRKIFSKGTLNEERDQTPLGGKSLLGRYAGVGYFEPWLFDAPIDGTLAFNYKAEARDNLWEISRSAEATISHKVRKLRPKTLIEAFTLYKEAREEAEGSVKDATLIDSGNLQIREVGLRHTTDGRNNLAWPTKGYRVTSEVSTAGYVFGGGLKYFKWGLGYNIYREIVTNFVVAAGFNYSTYVNVQRRDSSDVLPSSERLAAGGPETNRGFRENTLGPVFVAEDGKQIFDGGSRRGAHRLELRYQLIPETMALTTFLDSSNSSFSKKEERRIGQEHAEVVAGEGVAQPMFADNQPYRFEDMLTHPQYLWTKNYVSYGLAGNYLTPLGSVNLSFGWPWRRCLNNEENCLYPRGNSNYRKLQGAIVSLNIGANF